MTNSTILIIGGIVLAVVIILLIALVVIGRKRGEAKTVSFTPKEEKEEPKELTQQEKSGNYQAKGGFNFAAGGGAAPGAAVSDFTGEKKAEKQPVAEAASKPEPKVVDEKKPEVPEPKVKAEKSAAEQVEPKEAETEKPQKAEPVEEKKLEPKVVDEKELEVPDSDVDAPVADEPAVVDTEVVAPVKNESKGAAGVAGAAAAAGDASADEKSEDKAEAEAPAETPEQETTESEAPAEPETEAPAEETPEEIADDAVDEASTEDGSATEAEAEEAAAAAAVTADAAEEARESTEVPAEPAASPEPEEPVEEIAPAAGRLGRLRGRLSRSQNMIGKSVLGILSAGDLDEDAWEEIEDTLIMADLGTKVTMEAVEKLRERIAERGVSSEAEARAMLREVLIEVGRPELDRSIKAMPYDGKPAVVLMVGVNGTGKTTTTGKLGRVLVSMGHKVLFGAADTFRAAAADQLETWGRRVGATTVRGNEGADPASVAFDAVARGIEEHADVVLVDTAGRLHTSVGLMDQLGKVKRVVEKRAKVDEVLLVLDATVGQNGLMQARTFRDVVDITGVVLTKLDGTAKGGIVFQVQEELGVPVKLVGLGEGADDLAPFEVEGFVDALLG
ncbi:signal recognition particle-docking protein FtsY [Corynebacterium frankenforstense]|uniref:signal recognition particle-docking protein FtsY n=1 Tax=Corynebacterium frankenforstense TaxID=1230998 RepID=UPI0026EDC47D|nr:signal recognition particle-docking protein FtsY [Corynebacterium frankenforstense]